MKTFSHPAHPHLTKIVATISDENGDVDFIRELYQRGMDVVRMNSAHMKLEFFAEFVRHVREVSPNLAVMIDTKGPNIRTCDVADSGVALKKNDRIRVSGTPGSDGRICVNYAAFADEVPVGSRIVCDDGAVEMKVVGKEADYLDAELCFDCVVENRKSVNVPDVALKAPALSGRDREFLAAAVALQCDFVAHSFVRNAADITAVRAALGEAGKKIKIIAKIENREGVAHIDEILRAADGIMVARGDLGIEIPLEEVPAIQKQLIAKAREFAKPVITATQMLQSMTHSPLPTRAEVSDVANAVYDGSDAVMLSGETAHGQYPLLAVEMMRKIVCEAERAPEEFFPELAASQEEHSAANFLLLAAVKSPDSIPVKAIVSSTLSGRSARLCSAFRPKIRIYAPTPDEITMRQLALSYGVFPVPVPFDATPETQAVLAISSIVDPRHLLKDEDLVAVLGKFSNCQARNNLLCISSFGELKVAVEQ